MFYFINVWISLTLSSKVRLPKFVIWPPLIYSILVEISAL
jgi:hypothetical protein